MDLDSQIGLAKGMRVPLLLSLALLGAIALSGCSDGESCITPGQFSTADSGGLCQVNFFGDIDYAVYCSPNASGGFDCACGAAVDNPLEFTSPDFCDLGAEERACAAVDACNFPL